MYSTRAFWQKRPIGQVYRKGRNVTSRHRRNVTAQTPVVSMTTRLISELSHMKHTLEVSKSDLQAVKIRLVPKLEQKMNYS